MTSGAHDVVTSGFALGVALIIHSVAAIVVSRVDVDWVPRNDPPLEIDVSDPPPPVTERPPPRGEPEPPPEPPRPKTIARLVAKPEPMRLPRPSAAPPPPNQQPPPNAPRDAPPVFGVTMSSVVSGEAAMAVPVGNTTMAKPNGRPGPAPPQPYAGAGTKPFVPTQDVYVKTPPHVLREINSDSYYPPDAKALGIEGLVKLSVDIDEKGRVVAVRVVRSAGHGFDENAVKAMKEVPFSPALTSDGRAVPYRLTYDYRFEQHQ